MISLQWPPFWHLPQICIPGKNDTRAYAVDIQLWNTLVNTLPIIQPESSVLWPESLQVSVLPLTLPYLCTVKQNETKTKQNRNQRVTSRIKMTTELTFQLWIGRGLLLQWEDVAETKILFLPTLPSVPIALPNCIINSWVQVYTDSCNSDSEPHLHLKGTRSCSVPQN